jgi:hypothetical protein
VSEFVRLILPCHKADCFDDRRLYDLLAGEHTPRHGIRTFGVGIRAEVAGFVDDVVGDVKILLDVREEDSQQFRGNEELEVGLERDQLQK